MENNKNVIPVRPRRYSVNYKGLHGWVEYHPATKTWQWTFKAQFTIKNGGSENTKEEAELQLKKYIDTAAVSKNIRSVD